METIIDSLKAEDLQGLKELYEDGFGGKSDFDMMKKTFASVKSKAEYNILCAKVDDKVVGSVLGVVCHELFGDCSPFMVVEDVVVLNEYRRQGIAKKLLVELENRAKVAGCSMILFVSSKHRTGAHKLYESLGYGEDQVNGYRKRIK